MRRSGVALLPRAAPIVSVLAAIACGSAAEAPAKRPELAAAAPGATNAALAPSRPPILGAEASAITFERMARFPDPGWQVPRQVAFAPGDQEITFLQGEAGSETMELYAHDLRTGTNRVLARAEDLVRSKRPFSREEELRRERQRQRIVGITSYAWAKKSPIMVLPLGGDLFVRKADGTGVRLTDTPEPEIDPKLCDSGERVAFVRGSELYAIDVANGRETALTKGAPEGMTRGQSDFNGQEEFDEPSGFFWAPTCDRIAYLEVDERRVDHTNILGFRQRKADLMQQAYPVAGATNPRVRVGVLDVRTKKTTWLKWPDDAERYVGRFVWSADGSAIWLETLARDQRRLTLVRADPATGATREIVTESSPTWIEFADMRLLERSPRFVWAAQVEGHTHLELRDATTGARIRALTSGAWDVASIAAIDEERQLVWFTATKDGPLERHLYAVAFDGGAPSRITREPGVHDVTMDTHGRAFVDIHSAIDRLPQAIVQHSDGRAIGELPCPRDADLAALGLRTPSFMTVRSRSGEPLLGALLTPRHLEPGRRYPTIVMVYGGPGVQTVLNQWAPRLLWQHLADRGFVVFQLDNHGSTGRGHGFEAPIYGHLGTVELDDQLAGVDTLSALPFVDANRIGIYGHSFGGFMATLAMLRAPERFRVGVAGSPVTDWRLYDTGYTERYMGTPSANAAGYEAADLSKLAPNLRGHLLVIHALMDENVHFQNTAQLVDALVAADRPFDLLVYPGERHGYRGAEAHRYAFHRVVDYFVEHL